MVFAAVLSVPSAADAYRLQRGVVPQPELRYWVGVSDWKGPMARAVRALNRERVGVRLVRVRVQQQASIQVGRLTGTRCGRPGVNGTTQTFRGGYAAIYLPRGCRGRVAVIIAAHELGHAVGLLHENRRCALMNAKAVGRQAVPYRCVGRRYDWLRRPFRADDLAGLRRLYRNTAPVVRLRVERVTGSSARFSLDVRDREKNLSEVRIDFGDGSGVSGATSARQLPRSHSYSEPGSYEVELEARDLYGRVDRAVVRVEIAAGG